jgi:hypothetical protein
MMKKNHLDMYDKQLTEYLDMLRSWNPGNIWISILSFEYDVTYALKNDDGHDDVSSKWGMYRDVFKWLQTDVNQGGGGCNDSSVLIMVLIAIPCLRKWFGQNPSTQLSFPSFARSWLLTEGFPWIYGRLVEETIRLQSDTEGDGHPENDGGQKLSFTQLLDAVMFRFGRPVPFGPGKVEVRNQFVRIMDDLIRTFPTLIDPVFFPQINKWATTVLSADTYFARYVHQHRRFLLNKKKRKITTVNGHSVFLPRGKRARKQCW